MNTKMKYWLQLQKDFLDFLENKGYSHSSLVHYRGNLELLTRFAFIRGYDVYSPDVGDDFIEFEKYLDDKGPFSIKFKETTIRRLNEFCDSKKFTFARLRVLYTCPEEFKDVLDDFLNSLAEDGLKENTVNQYRWQLIKMLVFFHNENIHTWKDIRLENYQKAFEISSNKAQFSTYTKRFFKYLVEQGIITTNYSGILPPVRYPKRVPSVYSKKETDEISNNIDRDTLLGKRDYAIFLLALKLGLRASDIRFLSFDEVDFDKKLINFVQYKTGNPQSLRLLPEVEDALIKYIQVREKGNIEDPEDKYIFLTNRRTTLSRSAVSTIINKYFLLSDIKIGNRHHGPHALRMTFASELVSESVPFEVVRELLGHEDKDAISHYVLLATESLRKCALNIPAPSGAFLNLLNGEETNDVL